ncbi:unnamed protein product [Parnassius apollo]|uniref:(apollo) hypothetical protein n=1 Tax=Parnassius apollo TaxID=110799 RepID=A0A8S3WS57_PARAO|nr:unnamed protein product [Parnassius apollo]
MNQWFQTAHRFNPKATSNLFFCEDNFDIDAATKKKITFEKLARQITSTASCLKKLSVKQSDVVAICSENRIEYLISAIAIFCSGAILVCVNNGYSEDEMVHALHISKPKYMFMSLDAYNKYYKLIKSLTLVEKFIIFDNISMNFEVINFNDMPQGTLEMNIYEPTEVNGGTALILYSSGTTGLAKGAKINHRSLIIAVQQPIPSKRNVVMLTITPWSSTMGIVILLRELFYGKTIAFLPRFDEKLFLHTIQTYKVCILTVAPPTIVTLCKSTIVNEFDISSVEIIHSGGAPLNSTVIKELKTRFPHVKSVLQGYGMTETTGALTAEVENMSKEGSVGKIVCGNIIKIVDFETRKILGPGQVGEVCVKGPILFDGYIGKDSKDDFDEDGFYKTGDIAYYDEDGFFYIVDRIKELMKYKAWQVPPSELEDLIMKLPTVKDVGVVGIPDSLAGELPTAFIVKQPNMDVKETDIVKYVNTKVSPWKRLRGGVIFVKEIPKTGSGKILRRKLRDMIPKLPASKL